MTSRALTEYDFALPPRRQDIRVYEFDDEAVLLDAHAGQVQLLNRTAMAIWRRCDGQATIPSIVNELTADYGVDLETARDHVEQLVALFASAGLLAEGT